MAQESKCTMQIPVRSHGVSSASGFLLGLERIYLALQLKKPLFDGHRQIPLKLLHVNALLVVLDNAVRTAEIIVVRLMGAISHTKVL